jgi:hypothetical protein
MPFFSYSSPQLSTVRKHAQQCGAKSEFRPALLGFPLSAFVVHCIFSSGTKSTLAYSAGSRTTERSAQR